MPVIVLYNVPFRGSLNSVFLDKYNSIIYMVDQDPEQSLESISSPVLSAMSHVTVNNPDKTLREN